MKKTFIFSAAIIATLTACSDDVVNSYSEAKSTGKLTVSVIDGNSREPIKEATVKTQFDEKGYPTSENGFVYYENMDIGTYYLDISKKGYASVRKSIKLEETGANDVSRVPDVVANIYLYRSGVTVAGSVYYKDPETGNLLPAADVTVILTYPSASIMPSEILLQTDSTGSYKFEDLAEKVEYSIEPVQAKIEKKLYKPTKPVTASGLRTGTSKKMDNLIMEVDGEAPMLMSSNLAEIDTNTAVKLTFSSALNEDSLVGNWNVTKGKNEVLVLTNLSKDGKTLTIEPLSDKWSTKSSYTITGTAFSPEGISTEVTKSFTVGGTIAIPDQVSSLEVETDSTDYEEDESDTYNYNYNIFLTITWKAPKGDIDGYKIYYKTNEMDDYVFLSDVIETKYEKALGDLSTTITSAKKVDFVVLPYNAAGTADVSKAKIVSWTVVK